MAANLKDARGSSVAGCEGVIFLNLTIFPIDCQKTDIKIFYDTQILHASLPFVFHPSTASHS